MSKQIEPFFQLLMTARDKTNLLTFLNRASTNNLEEAQMLVNYAKGIQNAPAVKQPPSPEKKKAQKPEKKTKRSGAKT